MYVCGYTPEDKNLVLCEFTADEILKLGIDPEHLDLYDPGAISLVREGKEVLFSPMGSLLIVRHRRREEADFALFRDGERTVLRGEFDDFEQRYQNLTPSSTTFEEIFSEYVRGRGAVHFRKENGGNQRAWLFDGESIELEGAMVQLRDRLNMCYGKMFDWLPFPVKTPEVFDWLLGTFAQWQPVIFGRGVYHAYIGQKCRHVDVKVSSPALNEIRNLCSQLHEIQGLSKLEGGPDLQFMFDGVQIQFRALDRQDEYEEFTQVTVDMMECRESGWFHIRRIAAFDLGVSRYRILGGRWTHMTSKPEMRFLGESEKTGSLCYRLEFVAPEPLTGIWRVDR